MRIQQLRSLNKTVRKREHYLTRVIGEPTFNVNCVSCKTMDLWAIPTNILFN